MPFPGPRRSGGRNAFGEVIWSLLFIDSSEAVVLKQG